MFACFDNLKIRDHYTAHLEHIKTGGPRIVTMAQDIKMDKANIDF